MTLLTLISALYINCHNPGGCNIHVDQGISISSTRQTYLSCGSVQGCDYHLNPGQKIELRNR